MGRGREGVRDPLKHAASSYTVLVQHGKDIRVVARVTHGTIRIRIRARIRDMCPDTYPYPGMCLVPKGSERYVYLALRGRG